MIVLNHVNQCFVNFCDICDRVQELMSGEQRETGRIPRTMECHLTSDLCDSCVPGDTVAVTAIVRVANESTDIAETPILQPD